ncbi:MAG: hypothetical protein A3I26_01005 [Candidatus Yanofskybacteria bacterium RIFCSPLOWO2_02_FULL_43_10]|uniref:Uncharacterized protein n=1 Tax=Candidatus Yanofskybacteria bacterium RIFCSPLOWO2_12_FULL_43_11b TaxID=1802710 RepID=A0A1F8H814_9BACT|nr:MAG: hypothetical protein A2742_03555 [Candidatus Yanofskybacteria bacterium RIFCSPHIGHO2_01_FULL_43_32]OGN12114.1 MAG: hypothetical protein A3C69_02080 [Candidatus Yanofskybacteria bacterium RIFCSPHIGHO2_02_FULL_43_12]OGN18277.1 MAG: hypothetical protein A3E34_02615 [Candidatus Yanofskybacteria bacterium RIFCSPHIGHO2_12_FULL_43_11]OGN25238.1 MAG: hypothetical protein A2923_00680 [Candidatus Yanofskybacteria bacterium RIFCSPLOWO2_01_FULL_43_46]OGN30362.1 MAG: hypothetical protein A3I26_01005
MNILNIKKRSIFLLAGFVFALILAGSPASVTAVTDQEYESIADRYYTNLKNAMGEIGCNTVQECDDYCYKTGEPTPDCYAYDPLVTDPPIIVSYMQTAGCGESGDPFFKDFKTCVAYCDKELTADCFPFIGYREDLAGLNKLYDKFKNEDETRKLVLSVIDSIKNNTKLPPVCQRRVDCMNYCSSWVNTACIDYAEKTGYISSKYADKARKFLSLVKAGNPTPSGCDTMGQCEYICSQPENFTECTEFAKKAGWEEEILPEKQVLITAIQKRESPGQCKDEISCRNYCEDIDHIEECVSFVEKFNLASGDELKEIRKIADIKKAGVAFPGNCKSKESCLKYCDNSANAVVCMEFALKAEFIPKEDAEAVGKILPYLKKGGKMPGGCATKESCDAYCDTHAVECVDFAVGAGFMTKEDADIVRKTGGKGPGNCKSREACDNYCKDEKRIDECVDFAVKAGFISAGDAADAKKYKITSGPGNCKSKADCEALCVLPENQDICFKFAKDHGMISEEDLKNIEQYRNQGPPDFSQVNPKWLVCMEKEIGSDIFGRFKAGKSGRADVSAIQASQKKCESEMGSDVSKEIEVCLSKPTCAEFSTCMATFQQGGGEQQDGQQTPDPKVDARMKACKDEIQKEKTSACLSKSCSEFEPCLKSLEQSGDKKDGQQQAESTSDPAVNAKAQACQKEKINACLTKSCGEFQSCLNSLGGGGGEKQQGTPDPAVIAKVKSCQPLKQSGPQQQSPSSSPQSQQSGDQSQIPQGFSSWEAFCRANSGDSRCAAYAPQQYPLLLQHSIFAEVLNFLSGR